MRERHRVACPETKEQVLEKLIKAWDALTYMQSELKELAERMTIRIQHIDDDPDGTAVSGGTGVDAPIDLEARGNLKAEYLPRLSSSRR